jgi:tetratricopeptide (TPR) repeat protein
MNRMILVCLMILLPFLTQPGYSQQTERASVRLTVPQAPWTLLISGDALVLNREKIAPDGSQGYFMLVDEKTKMLVSLYIEPVDKCKTSKECRDMVWKLGNPEWQNPQNVRLSEIGEISILELLVPEFRRMPLQQQNMYAQFVRDGYWVDLHLSKVQYRDQDRELFERMVKSVRFEPRKAVRFKPNTTTASPAKVITGRNNSQQVQSGAKETIAKETMQLVASASHAYLQRDFKRAIELYTRALDLDNKQPTLNKNIWRVVVDNLGMSYGISGDNKRAKEVFEYGLSRDATYPMFYYNLACAHAEMNDLDRAIENLRLAFRYESNMIPGERLPNPAGDSSFRRYLNNPSFRQLLEEIRSK